MASKKLSIRHLFGGGWATDFGPSASVVPHASGDVVFPFLVDAENVYFELDGGPRKIGGTTKLNSSAVASGAQIMGLTEKGNPKRRLASLTWTKLARKRPSRSAAYADFSFHKTRWKSTKETVAPRSKATGTKGHSEADREGVSLPGFGRVARLQLPRSQRPLRR